MFRDILIYRPMLYAILLHPNRTGEFQNCDNNNNKWSLFTINLINYIIYLPKGRELKDKNDDGGCGLPGVHGLLCGQWS